ncbi:hypothetical protein HDU88_008745 [Geranomyces variabilis]|nr:hypothetical protein HDU88_008745 [Geranomyces variabilis]
MIAIVATLLQQHVEALIKKKDITRESCRELCVTHNMELANRTSNEITAIFDNLMTTDEDIRHERHEEVEGAASLFEIPSDIEEEPELDVPLTPVRGAKRPLGMANKEWQLRHMDSLEELLQHNKNNAALRDVVNRLKQFKPKPTEESLEEKVTLQIKESIEPIHAKIDARKTKCQFDAHMQYKKLT